MTLQQPAHHVPQICINQLHLAHQEIRFVFLFLLILFKIRIQQKHLLIVSLDMAMMAQHSPALYALLAGSMLEINRRVSNADQIEQPQRLESPYHLIVYIVMQASIYQVVPHVRHALLGHMQNNRM